MNDYYLHELARRLSKEDISVGPEDGGCLPVLLDGTTAMRINPKGVIFLEPEKADESEGVKLYDRVAGISAQVYEYTSAVASSPRLKADGLHENYRLLTSFGDVVLGGRKMEGGLGYEFTTWRYTAGRTGVAQGNYYHDYDAAKLDFACRSGLAQKCRQFTDEQLTEIYRCIHETLDSEYPITKERRDVLTSVSGQIEQSVDDLENRVNLSNQQELEIAEQRDSGSGWEIAP